MTPNEVCRTILPAHFDGMRLRTPKIAAAIFVLLAAWSGVAATESDGDETAGPRKAADLGNLSIEQLGDLKVTSASLHDQRIYDAPASMTVITAEEIRRFGYRTLAEALSYVRGFYTTDDHSYSYLGVRGFSLPGDYGTRMIVMINGHSVADNIFDQSVWLGNDFPLDLSLVEKIEVARGASSALYGSNGMLATINIITRKPAEARGAAVRVETGSLGERKIEAGGSLALPRGANLLTSVAVFNNAGAHQLYFPEYDAAATNFGRAIDADGEKGYHAFADLSWKNWELLAVAGDRVKNQPISWGDFVFNDRGASAEDSRAFLDLSYARDLPGDRTLTWRASYDAYRYRGIYHLWVDGRRDEYREKDYGDALGSKFSYRLPDWGRGYLTVGAELRFDLRARQHAFDPDAEDGDFLNVNKRDRYAGVFLQQEWTLGKRWNLNLGGRYDWSWLRRKSFSPRAALIFKPAEQTDIKFLYSRGFCNPSNYEMFYSDDGVTQLGNPALRPETVDTIEVDFDRALTRRIRLGSSLYRYRVNGLIEQVYTAEGLLVFVNKDLVRAAGGSLELGLSLPRGIDLTASMEVQRATFGSGGTLPNSPREVGKLHASMPLWRNLLTLGVGLQMMGARSTYAGVVLPRIALPEAVISTRPLPGGLQLSGGVKNLSNSFYRDPAGLNAVVDSLIGRGRAYYLNLSWHSEPDSGPKAGRHSAH